MSSQSTRPEREPLPTAQSERPGHEYQQVVATQVGLRFPAGLTFDGWQQAGRQIARIVNSSAWCVGDWIVYGECCYGDRYRSAVELAGLDYQTVRNYVWVARRFDISRRHEDLSFQHHAEVASLPPAEQDSWLDRAARESWSRNQLRVHLRASRANGSDGDLTLSSIPRINTNTERVERWRAAAAKADVDFKIWVLASLDAAAQGILRNPKNM